MDSLDPNELVFWKISDESLDDGIGFVRFFPEFDDLLSGDAEIINGVMGGFNLCGERDMWEISDMDEGNRIAMATRTQPLTPPSNFLEFPTFIFTGL